MSIQKLFLLVLFVTSVTCCTTVQPPVKRQCQESEEMAIILSEMAECSSKEAELRECYTQYVQLRTVVLLCAQGYKIILDPETSTISVGDGPDKK